MALLSCYTQVPLMVISPQIDELYREGFALRCDGRYAEARSLFERVLALDPKHLSARHQIGLVQGFEGDFDGSYATLNGLCIENPTNLTLQYDLAMTQMMLGMYEDACARLRYILSVNPTHEDANRQVIYC